jgi:hypothetical protein
MWMEIGLLLFFGMIPVVVVIAVFEVSTRKRLRDLKLRADRDWHASRELRSPE